MRFRKSIKICKGVRVNLSKSGMSLTAGMPGLSVNYGKKGTYLNTGIPGTGLYDRKKIGSSTVTSNRGNNQSYTNMQVNLHVDDNGVMSFYDQYGFPITDSSLLRKIKSTENYKREKEHMMQESFKNINESSANVINMHKLSVYVNNKKAYTDALQNLKLEKYTRNIFQESEPVEQTARYELKAESIEKVKSWKFWKIKLMREDYITEHLEDRYHYLLAAWKERKNAFEKNEDHIEASANADFLEQYNATKINLENILQGSEKYVEDQLNNWVSSLSLPVDFSLQFKYVDSLLMLDLDLPEIESLPKEKATMLSSGVAKKKNKTQKELKEDYIRCIFGLAIFFASNAFNITPVIETIIISGYSQRRVAKTGELKDEYLYSVKFDRKAFEGVNLKAKEPYEFCMKFENRVNVTSTMQLKAVEPF